MMFFRQYLSHLSRFVGAAIAVIVVSLGASAQTYSAQPLRIIVACAVGTPTDLVARHFAKDMLETSGQRAYVENFTAGGAPIGIDTVKKLLADDHSMLFNLGNCDN